MKRRNCGIFRWSESRVQVKTKGYLTKVVCCAQSLVLPKKLSVLVCVEVSEFIFDQKREDKANVGKSMIQPSHTSLPLGETF